MIALSKLKIVAGVCAFIALTGFFLHYRGTISENTRLKTDLKAAYVTIEKQSRNIAFTERAAYDYESNLIRLNTDIERLRERPAKCVPVARSTGFSPETGSGPGHVKAHGISSKWLYDYAEDAEQLRIERNACRDFVKSFWESER